MKKFVKQPIVANQMQFSIAVSNMIANGMEVNMTSDGSADRDESVLDYCRLNDITVQAWSPLQMPNWQGCFIGSEKYKDLNACLNEIAEDRNTSPSVIAYAWILRHPAGIQVVTGTTKIERIKEACDALCVNLSAEEWYRLYLSAGHPLP